MFSELPWAPLPSRASENCTFCSDYNPQLSIMQPKTLLLALKNVQCKHKALLTRSLFSKQDDHVLSVYCGNFLLPCVCVTPLCVFVCGAKSHALECCVTPQAAFLALGHTSPQITIPSLNQKKCKL